MTWSYSGDPSVSAKDAVRFYCGDTDVDYAFVTDEEIIFILKSFPDPRSAAVKVCDQIIAGLAKQVDYTIGPESVKASQRLENYMKVRDRLKADLVGAQAVPSWHDPRLDRRRPIFDIGIHDFPGVPDGSPN